MTPQDLEPGKLYFFDMEGYGPGGHRIVEGTAGWSGSQHERYHKKATMYVGPADEELEGFYVFLFEDRTIKLTEATIRFNLTPATRPR